MQPLDTPITRECQHTSVNGRPVIITMHPDDYISLRLKRTQTTYRVPIIDVVVRAMLIASGPLLTNPPTDTKQAATPDAASGPSSLEHL